MKRLLIALAFLWAGPALAQQNTQCIGIGGINNVPIPGINCLMDPTVPSYAAAHVSLVPASTATDIACLNGSATRTIRLKRIVISGVAGTAINVPIFIAKRNALDTGGTPPTTIATGLGIPFALDSTFPAVSATVQSFTANPTIADTQWTTALANIITSVTVPFAATGTLIGQQATVIDFSQWAGISPPVLRGAVQSVCISMNTSGQTIATPSSGLVSITWLWTEQTQ